MVGEVRSETDFGTPILTTLSKTLVDGAKLPMQFRVINESVFLRKYVVVQTHRSKNQRDSDLCNLFNSVYGERDSNKERA